MKFVYVDETGDKGQSDVFVMTGLLIDAYSLRKYTASFDEMLTTFLARHPGSPKELKTKAFINGEGGWRNVDPAERKKFLEDVCNLARPPAMRNGSCDCASLGVTNPILVRQYDPKAS